MILNIFKNKLSIIICFLLIALSNFYLTTITKLSPAYIGIVLSLMCFLLFYNAKIKASNKTSVVVLFCFFYFVYLIIDCVITGNSEKKSYYINYFIFNQLFFVVSVFYLQQCNFKGITNIIGGLVFFSVFIFVLDAVYRVIFAVSDYSGLLAFYNYKESGLMFDDSNWSGFMSMLIYSFFLYLRDRKVYYRKGIILLFFVLTVLTISRAAILSCLLITMYSWYKKKNKYIRIRLFLLFMPILVFAILYAINNITDGSFVSKLGMVGGLGYYITTFDSHTIFWGNYPEAGLDGRTFMNYWLGGHLYLTRFIDFGLGALIIELLFLLLINFYSNNQAFYIIFPFFIAGLSFAPGNLPYMYMYLAIIYVIENSLYKKHSSVPNLSFRFKKDFIKLIKYK